VTPAGFEPAIFAMRGRCPRPLDDGATNPIISKLLRFPPAFSIIRQMQPYLKQVFMALGITASIAFLSFSYWGFQTYRPPLAQDLQDVKSYKTNKFAHSVPYIEGARELGVSETSGGRQITLEVEKPYEVVLDFYQSVLSQQGWKEVSQKEYPGFSINEYERENYFLTMSISDEQKGEITVIGINLIDLQ
jgi:hypothetical protein